MLRTLAAVLAVLALVAMLPVPCPCPEEAAAPPSGHECCVPPTGVSSNDHGCCDGHAAATGILVPGPAPFLSSSDVAAVRLEPLARLDASPRGSGILAPSPPPAILRL